MSRLSLAVKLYAIFALVAVLIAAMTALSDYNSRRNTELTDAVATASRAALNVQRVNSLVYAVVMESRGVYMSGDRAGAKKFGDGLLKFNDQLLVVVKNWESLVQSDDADQFAIFKKRIDQFVRFARNWFAGASRSTRPPAANGATTTPTVKCVPRSTRTSTRFQKSMPSAASGWRSRPTPARNWLWY